MSKSITLTILLIFTLIIFLIFSLEYVNAASFLKTLESGQILTGSIQTIIKLSTDDPAISFQPGNTSLTTISLDDRIRIEVQSVGEYAYLGTAVSPLVQEIPQAPQTPPPTTCDPNTCTGNSRCRDLDQDGVTECVCVSKNAPDICGCCTNLEHFGGGLIGCVWDYVACPWGHQVSVSPPIVFDKEDKENVYCGTSTKVTIVNSKNSELVKEISGKGIDFKIPTIRLDEGTYTITVGRSYSCPQTGEFVDSSSYKVQVVKEVEPKIVVPETCKLDVDCGKDNYCLDVDGDGVKECVDAKGNKIESGSIAAAFVKILNNLADILNKLVKGNV